MLKTVVKFTFFAIEKPYNYEVRANLMWASFWALNGFSRKDKPQKQMRMAKALIRMDFLKGK